MNIRAQCLALSQAEAGHDTAAADNPILARLSRLAPMSAPEIDLLCQLPRLSRTYPRQTQLSDPDQTNVPRILFSGWAIHQHISRSGRRQILQFLLPGDLIGSACAPESSSVNVIVALTTVTVADARPLLRAITGDGPPMPGLAIALRALMQAEYVRTQNHIVRLGSQTAYERLTHLVLELHQRLEDVGLAEGNEFSMPLTQEMLADTLGMSFVHTNRVLQQLSRDGLFTVRGKRVTLLRPDLMRSVAGLESS